MQFSLATVLFVAMTAVHVALATPVAAPAPLPLPLPLPVKKAGTQGRQDELQKWWNSWHTEDKHVQSMGNKYFDNEDQADRRSKHEDDTNKLLAAQKKHGAAIKKNNGQIKD